MGRIIACEVIKAFRSQPQRRLTAPALAREAAISDHNARNWMKTLDKYGLVKYVGKAAVEGSLMPQRTADQWEWQPAAPQD